MHFVAKYNIKTNYLEYFKVLAALKQFKKVCSPVLDNPSSNDSESSFCHAQILTKNLTDALNKTRPLHHYRVK